MVAFTDPFEVLGLDRGATLSDAHMAYRRAALKHHPDRCRGDRRAAEQRFSRIADAYRGACRAIRRAETGARARRAYPTYQPADFTRMDLGWQGDGLGGMEMTGDERLGRLPGSHRIAVPTRNEPKAFLGLWALALLAALAVTCLYARVRIGNGYLDDLSLAEAAIIAVLPVAAYAALAAGALTTVLLSRKVVWLVGRLSFWARRALPHGLAGEVPPSRASRQFASPAG